MLDILQKEIDLIQDEEVREFVIKFLHNVPEYFWTVPASSSGKYHPQYALGEGGLARHVKATVKIALSLLSLEMYQHLPKDEMSVTIVHENGHYRDNFDYSMVKKLFQD